ncbi:MAG: SUMF1/EgtB/PvdO family nonheme iron enzyme [Myxococcales bacterium]|nr:SUMF1/EgtB/PvdO family nonheme iron enzyme [Myxococcales bacterium]
MLPLLFALLAPPADRVALPAGPFIMGCAGELPLCDPKDESPPHTVDIDAFSIDRRLVSNTDWQACLAAGACQRPEEDVWYDPEKWPDAGVVGITWAQAAGYCAWRGARLPTEAEFARAARGTNGRTYPWGEDFPTCAHFDCGGEMRPRVGQHPGGATPEGVEDLTGVLKQWTADWFLIDAHAHAPVLNPIGPPEGSQRVVRGIRGGPGGGLAGARRMGWPPGRTQTQLGFRCAADGPGPRRPKTPTLVPPAKFDPAWKAITIAAGEAHTCALAADGRVWCTGNNQFGQRSKSATVPDRFTPIDGLGKVDALAVGPLSTCVRSEGALRCFGQPALDDPFGVAGRPLGRPAGPLFAINDNICAIALESRQLACAERDGPFLPYAQPTGITSLALGNDHLCAIAGDGQLWCFGSNATGQLGFEDEARRDQPVAVTWPADLTPQFGKAVEVVAGSHHTCVRHTDGHITCFGRGTYGALGRPMPTIGRDHALGPLSMHWPVPVAAIDDAIALAAGYDHTCAIRKDHTLWCWGDNTEAQLGDGTLISRARPAPVPGLTDVRAVSASRATTCALTGAGALWCWGENEHGQLGDGTRATRLRPIRVSP